MPAETDTSPRKESGVRALYYGLVIVVFLVLVALVALLTNGHADDLGDLLGVLLPVLLWLTGLILLIWFIVTLNSIARSLREQTRIARHTARQLDLLVTREGVDIGP